jgi:ribosomal-protein-serine acetyltransferase
MDKKYLEKKLTGKRIYLKEHELDLAQTMFDYVDSDRVRLKKFLPWVDFISKVDDQVEYIEKCHQDWMNYSTFDYGIYTQEDDTYMGNIGVHTISWSNSTAEIGYWILGGFEGKGFMSEAVGVVEKELFGIGFNRIEIRCSSLNERSSAVPKRCDYIFEGKLRKNSVENGEFRDTFIYSKLKEEYEAV